jgi:hypothetical protein
VGGQLNKIVVIGLPKHLHHVPLLVSGPLVSGWLGELLKCQVNHRPLFILKVRGDVHNRVYALRLRQAHCTTSAPLAPTPRADGTSGWRPNA